MGQPVVHFEIIGADPARLRGFFGGLLGGSSNQRDRGRGRSEPTTTASSNCSPRRRHWDPWRRRRRQTRRAPHAVLRPGPRRRGGAEPGRAAGRAACDGPGRSPNGLVVGDFTDPRATSSASPARAEDSGRAGRTSPCPGPSSRRSASACSRRARRGPARGRARRSCPRSAWNVRICAPTRSAAGSTPSSRLVFAARMRPVASGAPSSSQPVRHAALLLVTVCPTCRKVPVDVHEDVDARVVVERHLGRAVTCAGARSGAAAEPAMMPPSSGTLPAGRHKPPAASTAATDPSSSSRSVDRHSPAP